GEIPTLETAHADPLSGADAAVAHLRTANNIPFGMEVSSFHPTNLRRVLLRLEGAVCQLDSTRYDAVLVRQNDSSENIIKLGDAMPLLEELRAFLLHISGGPPPFSSLLDELRIIEEIAKIDELISQK
ncbi:MAG: hypothetical protein ABW199_05525, partial [Caulobacterales bacterium]